jgi:hypothetical protein
MANDRGRLPEASRGRADLDKFLRKLASTPAVRPAAGQRGRLIFALDATASRQPTWDRACGIQAEMFEATSALGGLDIQLVFYRGFREFEAGPWLDSAADLLRQMTAVTCLGGRTQIAKVLRHALAETKRRRVNAVVFVGDCVEEEADTLCHDAGQLGLLGVPLFVFHEGGERMAADALRQMARLTNGAYCPFDANSAQQLRDLLSAVAVYAAGGRAALEDFSRRTGGATRLLIGQVPKS